MTENIVRSQFVGVYPPTHLSLTEFIMKAMEPHADQVGFIDPISSRQLTFGEIHKYVTNVAGALYRRGVRKGDVVCIFSPNVLEYVIAFHAVIAAGGILTTVNPTYTPGELVVQLTDCAAKYIITIPALVKVTDEACRKYGNMQGKLVFGDASGLPGYEAFSELMKDGPPPPPIQINVREDVCCLPYSSGTTGVPKGVMLTHYNLIANMCQCTHPGIRASKQERDVLIGVLPFFHSFGIFTLLNMTLLTGNLVIVLPKFDLKLYLQSIQKYKATALMIVPPLAVVLAKHPMVAQYDLSSVKNVSCGAAPLSATLTKELQKKMPEVEGIKQGYGLTETSPVVAISADRIKPGCAGTLTADTELKVIDLGTGESLTSYRSGEICVRGPQIMKGYLNNEEATKRTIDSEGWLHTGDIGYYDKDGDIFIIDRLKELIKYKAFQVAPAELEALLLTHPAVADAAVIGVPDEMSGELPRAYIVLKPGAKTSAEEIINFVKGQVAPFKRLRGGVEFMTEVPKSPSGKIMRRQLKQQIQNKAKL